MTVTPNWVSVNMQLGYTQPGQVDAGITASDGTVSPSVPIGTIAYFRDTSLLALGVGGFVFLPGVTSTARGDVVTYRQTSGAGRAAAGPNGGAATARWAGTANNGFPLAVATAAVDLQSKWGWYQVQGAAVVNTSGTVTAGNATYWGQVATLQTNAAVGGKQVLGIQASSADGSTAQLESGKAIFTLNNPVVQSQIT